MAVDPENRRIFESARDHLDQASLKNSEQLDKAILTLSSAGLALSLSFSNSLMQLASAENAWSLKISWICFSIAIVSTLISFLTSASAVSVEREHIYKYYMEGIDGYGATKNLWGIVTYYINRFSVFVFITAVAFSVLFIWSNVPSGEKAMSNKPHATQDQKGYIPPKKQPASTPGESSQGQGNKPATQDKPAKKQ